MSLSKETIILIRVIIIGLLSGALVGLAIVAEFNPDVLNFGMFLK